jgi:hypothetical protein
MPLVIDAIAGYFAHILRTQVELGQRNELEIETDLISHAYFAGFP